MRKTKAGGFRKPGKRKKICDLPCSLRGRKKKKYAKHQLIAEGDGWERKKKRSTYKRSALYCNSSRMHGILDNFGNRMCASQNKRTRRKQGQRGVRLSHQEGGLTEEE